MGPEPTLFIARGLVPRASRLEDAVWGQPVGLLVLCGRVQALVRSPRAARHRATRVVDLGEALILPGLVNAHAHLDLSALEGQLAPPAVGESFVAWIGAVLRARAACSPARVRRAAAGAEQRLLASGTTTLGDFLGVAWDALARPRLLTRRFREVLDAHDPQRTAAQLDGVARGPREGRLLREGFGPHAPHTAGPALLAGLARARARRPRPLSVHWSETEEECAWLQGGGGPFAPLLGRSPRRSGLDLLAGAGLLGPSTSLVHGNHPARGEPARLAAAGATLVHCPGTHAWFDRAPFPLGRYRRAGVRLALGTDSLASNEALDLRREVRLLRRAHPEVTPDEALVLATEGSAAALGLTHEVGSLEPGRRADFLVVERAGTRGRDALGAFWEGASRLLEVRLAGRRAWGAGLP